MRDQGDLRAALMVKDKVLEDREKVTPKILWGGGGLLAFPFFVGLMSVTTPLIARVDVMASGWCAVMLSSSRSLLGGGGSGVSGRGIVFPFSYGASLLCMF